MKCTECNDTIAFQEEDITIHAVYSDGRVRRVCRHVVTFDEADPGIIAILGSQECADKWFSKQGEASVSN